MTQESRPPTVFRFGTFEVDLRTREMRKQGVRIKIQGQPFHVLTLLLQRPGEMVTREELRSKIWQSDTFVDFDNGLNTSINRLREALGDSAESPRYIETLPRRGYRFIAPVTTDEVQTPVTTSAAPVGSPRTRTILSAAAVLAIGAVFGMGLFWLWRQTLLVNERDTIVLADFANSTGDPVFDGTLRQGLAVQLEQSPFLSLVSEEQVQQTLRLMRQSPDAPVTLETAREICQRTMSTIVVAGSIAQIGEEYSLILRAENCSNGEEVKATQAQARDKSHVLEALGRASSEIRNRLGESLATIQKFDTPLVQASTSSLEALQAYSIGHKAVTGKGDSAAAVPMFRRAIELDPNFAMAYASLGSSYWNLGENTLASENIRRAFELRTGVSDWEKLRIESLYYSLVTDDLEKAQGALEVWAQTYPRDWSPHNQLGMVHMALGQHDKALSEFKEALRLYQGSSLIRGNLISSYIALNRLSEARAAAEAAAANNPESPGLRINLYHLAFLRNDPEEMQKQVASAVGTRGLEDELLWNQAATAAYFGQVTKARSFTREAVASAVRAEEKEAAAGYEAAAALTAALYGNEAEARERVASALRLSTGADLQYHAAMALALTGRAAQARALAEDLDKRFPQDTIVRSIYLPTLRSQLALSRNDAQEAIDVLQGATPYEQTAELFPVYVRGLAYLAARRSSEAASEFQRVVSHPGIVLNSPIGALAHLQLGRAFAMQGDIIEARRAYQDYLALWRQADPDIPILKKAKAELAQLKP
jgi:DNA-binding winged helix-turn-helix (wHTH) protein/tetratricopeptide (TPR) repeat protein